MLLPVRRLRTAPRWSLRQVISHKSSSTVTSRVYYGYGAGPLHSKRDISRAVPHLGAALGSPTLPSAVPRGARGRYEWKGVNLYIPLCAAGAPEHRRPSASATIRPDRRVCRRGRQQCRCRGGPVRVRGGQIHVASLVDTAGCDQFLCLALIHQLAQLSTITTATITKAHRMPTAPLRLLPVTHPVPRLHSRH